MKQQLKLAVLAGLISCNAFAGTMGEAAPVSGYSWSVLGEYGYSSLYRNQSYRGDTNFSLGRLAIAVDRTSNWSEATAPVWGMELGIQQSFDNEFGNRTGFHSRRDRRDRPEGVASFHHHDNDLDHPNIYWKVQTQPVVDLLLTLKTSPMSIKGLFGQVKAGIAWQNWRLRSQSFGRDRDRDRDSSWGFSNGNQSTIAGELQAGIGFAVNQRVSLLASYQGLVRLTRISNRTNGRIFDNLPAQNGVLLGVAVNI